MSYFIKQGNTFNVADEQAIDIHRKLPAGNYMVKFDPMKGYFLEMSDRFEPEVKYYGEALKNADRILRTFNNRSSATGILLAGEKGSGKTLLARTLAIKGYEQDIPCIVINAPYIGDAFYKFLADIDQPAIVMFDEYEKVYDSEEQEKMLTLLDGVFPSQKMFVLTCNNKYKINYNMLNRPGRLFYFIEFDGLSQAFVREYCVDKMLNQSHVEGVCNIAAMFGAFNFDMLKALVEEMNRYDESPQEALKLLNIRPVSEDRRVFDAVIFKNGRKVDPDSYESLTWQGNPLMDNIRFEWEEELPADHPDNTGDNILWHCAKFTPMNLRKVDGERGLFLFESDEYRLQLNRQEPKPFNFYEAAY